MGQPRTASGGLTSAFDEAGSLTPEAQQRFQQVQPGNHKTDYGKKPRDAGAGVVGQQQGGGNTFAARPGIQLGGSRPEAGLCLAQGGPQRSIRHARPKYVSGSARRAWG